MRAAVLAAPGRFELTTVRHGPVPEGRSRVRVEGCGVCGSNLPVFEGRPWFTYPLAAGLPGHESWGVVEEPAGGEAEGLRPGSRVAILCDGAFSERLDVEPWRLVPLPPALDGKPFPGEALGAAFNVAARSRLDGATTVCVVGVGFIGALLVAIAAHAGARVIAVSRRPFSREVAAAMGADAVVDGADPDAACAAVGDLTDGELCDVVIEAAGAQGALDLAGRLTRVRGTLVVAGFHQDGPRRVDLQLWNWRGIDVVNAHERDDLVVLGGMRRAVEACADGWLDPTPLYTHRLPLARVGEGMRLLGERPAGFVKALVLA